MTNGKTPAITLCCLLWALVFTWSCAIQAQAPASGEAGQPLIRVAAAELPSAPVIIAYGDMRFTDPSNTTSTDPKARRWLVNHIAIEKPVLLLLSGDVPLDGGQVNDYAVYHEETTVWRIAHLLVSPALGNHEFHGGEQACLENWWREFPKLRGRRWYSVALGSKIYALNLDSNASLLAGSAQSEWIKAKLDSLPLSVKFVFVNLHHPPVADFQVDGDADHNPRPNEIALANLLKTAPQRKRLRFIVTAGHIHNYERFTQDGVLYLVSGGGGAKPRPITRTAADLYQDTSFPNYHYVKFVVRENRLEGEMFRIVESSAPVPAWEVKDRFSAVAPN
jgi:acid phosphatase type 7